MKTIKEWVDTLPEDIRKRAYRYKSETWVSKENNLREAIMSAFIWRDTDEDVDFWGLVSIGQFDEARQLLTNNTIKP